MYIHICNCSLLTYCLSFDINVEKECRACDVKLQLVDEMTEAEITMSDGSTYRVSAMGRPPRGPAVEPGGGAGGVGWGRGRRPKRLFKAPTDLYKAPNDYTKISTEYTKPQKDYTKLKNVIQRHRMVDTNLKH